MKSFLLSVAATLALSAPALGVADLFTAVSDAWAKTTEVLKREDFFVNFETPFGKDHRILAPIVKFENKAAEPKYDWGPVPYCWEEYPSFKTALS